MKIAFTSCMSTATGASSQPVWDAIAKVDPDVLILLGDSVYIDCPPHPDRDGVAHPSQNGYNDEDFAIHLHALYQKQLRVPEFRALIAREKLRTFAIWDDHDFLWNDADFRNAQSPQHTGQAILSGNLLKCWRTSLQRHGVGFPASAIRPPNIDGDPVWRNHTSIFDRTHYDQSMPGYESVELAKNIILHLTDGRSWRNGQQMLGALQRQRMEEMFNDFPDAVHIIASGSTFAKNGRSGWQDCQEDHDWLLAMAGHFRLLMLSGDIHKNAFPEPTRSKGTGRLFYEVTASGAAVNFNPLRWLVNDPTNSWLDFSEKFGLLEFHDGQIDVNLIDHGDAKPDCTHLPYSRISLATW